MKPRADFMCLSKKCDVEGSGQVYELPVGSTHCPNGHKRLKQLFNSIAVVTRAAAPERDWRLSGTSLTRRADALLQDSFDDHTSKKSNPDVPTLTPGQSEREVNLPGQRKLVVPSAAQAAAMVGVRGGQGVAMKPLDIARSVRQDSLSVPAVLGYNRNGGRAPHHVPTDTEAGMDMVSRRYGVNRKRR